ncbi:hypothetical protein E2C01_098148 [Portunus trituberculatus]|uniref:Uncharacterized protein n=1 Tax=Portunus trituberculatus TaxID=210409 RepID=A0A5B7KC57_PORTR|nr:hypothetical protein [Portunus trituberculatus]
MYTPLPTPHPFPSLTPLPCVHTPYTEQTPSSRRDLTSCMAIVTNPQYTHPKKRRFKKTQSQCQGCDVTGAWRAA